jgi:hypothetical protein
MRIQTLMLRLENSVDCLYPSVVPLVGFRLPGTGLIMRLKTHWSRFSNYLYVASASFVNGVLSVMALYIFVTLRARRMLRNRRRYLRKKCNEWRGSEWARGLLLP